MKKITIAIFCLTAILLYTGTSNAQIIKFGVMGGLTDITSPSSYTNSITDNGKDFGANYNFGAQLRFDIPLVPLTPIVFIDYHKLTGSGTVGGSGVSTKQNIFSAGVEAEYSILPIPLVKPYISIEAAFNSFGDLKAEFKGVTTSEGSMTRFGGAIGAGTVITVLPVVDLDVSLKYNFFNLVGKESGEDSINALTLDLAIIF